MRAQMKKSVASILFYTLLSLSSGCSLSYGPAIDQAGISKLDGLLQEKIDTKVHAILPKYCYLNVAVVRNNEIVLTKSYGHDRLDKTDVYASVSKPVTAMIVLQLLQEGKILSLDDDIGVYHSRYKNAVPKKYGDSYVTFRQLLSHTSGVPHQSKLWSGGKLKLEFRPGTDVRYSTHGYGVLGDVIEEITGKSYRQLVREYVGKPINANSFKVMHSFFDAPAGQVASTIADMARFSIAVMNNKYISSDLLCDEVLKEYAKDRHGSIGLGWYCTGFNTNDLAGYHAGSNGRPRAFLGIKPYEKNSIAITGLSRSAKKSQDFARLTIDLMAIIENRDSNNPGR
jgi:CubicO group peptidase (beta-lactamase class C family)